MKKLIATLTIVFLLIPGAVFADATADNDADSSVQLNKLEFSQIEQEIASRNAQYDKIDDSIDMADDQVSSGSRIIKALIEKMRDITTDYIGHHSDVITTDENGQPVSTDPDVNAMLTLLGGQMSSLQVQMGSLPDMETVKTQGEKGKDQIVAGVQTLFISYNSLGRQLEGLKSNRNVLTLQLEALKTKVNLGMDTQLNLDDNTTKLTALDANIQAMQDAYDKLKHQLNLAVGQKYDTDMQIGETPRVQANDIDLINVASDYLDAQNLSYDIELNKNEDTPQVEDSYRQFENSFYETYQDLKTKELTFNSEEQNMKVVKSNYDILELKYNLGMISTLQYEQGKDQYNSAELKYYAAQDAVFQAYNNYQWAKKGLILSSGTTTGSTSSGTTN